MQCQTTSVSLDIHLEVLAAKPATSGRKSHVEWRDTRRAHPVCLRRPIGLLHTTSLTGSENEHRIFLVRLYSRSEQGHSSLLSCSEDPIGQIHWCKSNIIYHLWMEMARTYLLISRMQGCIYTRKLTLSGFFRVSHCFLTVHFSAPFFGVILWGRHVVFLIAAPNCSQLLVTLSLADLRVPFLRWLKSFLCTYIIVQKSILIRAYHVHTYLGTLVSLYLFFW